MDTLKEIIYAILMAVSMLAAAVLFVTLFIPLLFDTAMVMLNGKHGFCRYWWKAMICHEPVTWLNCFANYGLFFGLMMEFVQLFAWSFDKLLDIADNDFDITDNSLF